MNNNGNEEYESQQQGQSDFDELLSQLRREFKPEGLREELLVRKIARILSDQCT
jgi:hypothetical protein